MNKILFFTLSILLFVCHQSTAQSYEPAAGQVGSNAIKFDSSIIVNWANGITVQRGYKDIADKGLGYASFGQETDGLQGGNVTTSVVSLGDSGVAVLTFENNIMNGPGPDFAIFENGFADNYLELAFVEVSSDGTSFFRFENHSETPVLNQVGPFDYSDCRYVNNLAGKYRVGYGTPFDLEELDGNIGLDINSISHVRLIDVIGTVNDLYASHDSQGNKINDLYPTNFESGGFDLDGVAVLHQVLGIEENSQILTIYPNPSSGILNFNQQLNGDFEIHNSMGQLVMKGDLYNTSQIVIDQLSGIYFLKINLQSESINKIITLCK